MSTASQELFQAWVIFPALLMSASICIGLAVCRFSRLDLSSLLVLPIGFSSLVVLGQWTTLNSNIAPFTPHIFLFLTFLSAICFWRALGFWIKNSILALTLGLAVFYLHGLPILLSGTPTFAGWIKLDDGAQWLALTDQILFAGRNTAILMPSTHEANMQILLNPIISTGAQGSLPYPSGSFAPLGVFSKWLFIDPAWTLQPYMAAATTVLCLTLLGLLKPIQIPNWSKFLAAFMAPTSALFLGYEMWGGIKELLLVPLIVLAIALIPLILENPNDPRRVVPFALTCSSYVLIFGLSGLVWLFMPVILLFVRIRKKLGKFPLQHTVVSVGVFLVGSLAVVIPVLKRPFALFESALFAQSSSDIGNLIGSLKFSQIFGIWLAGDFRLAPENVVVNTFLILLAAILFVIGCYFLIATGHSYVAFLGIWVSFLSVIALRGNAWISGKTLAMASPIVLAIAFCAIGFIANKFSLEAAIAATVLSSGVLASYAYTYNEVWLAPYEKLKELEVIGKDLNYSPPALMIDYSPYGARHFLRKLDAESASDLRRNLIPLRSGEGLDKGETADIDEFALESVQNYQTLVIRSSANSSRPPWNYILKFSGEYYEVWQKNPELKLPVEHFAFGNKEAQYGVPECSFIESEIATKLPGNEVLVSSAQNFIRILIESVTQNSGEALTYEGEFEVKNSGNFDLWVEGWVKGRAKIFIDGNLVTTTSHVLNPTGNMTKIGFTSLEGGQHALKVVTDSPWSIPGSGGLSNPMGPFYLSDQNRNYSVEVVQPDDLDALCTRPVDWIELVPL